MKRAYQEIRLLPPLAVSRLGDLPEPVNNYELEVDRWRWHRDLLVAARDLLDELESREQGSPRLAYVRALRDSDANTLAVIEAMIIHLDARVEVTA